MPATASISVHIPPPLREHIAGAREVRVSGASVREVLAELGRAHPQLHRNICDESGVVRRHIGVFVNKKLIRERDGIDTALADGDVVFILPAVSGG